MKKQEYLDELHKMFNEDGLIIVRQDKFWREFEHIKKIARRDTCLSTKDYLDLFEEMEETLQHTTFISLDIIDTYNDKMNEAFEKYSKPTRNYQKLDEIFEQCVHELRNNDYVDNDELDAFIKEWIDYDRLNHMTL